MNIVQRATQNKNAGRAGWVPDMIVCHITEGSFDGAVSWLCNPASVASSHFVVSRDGRVTQLVAIEDTAWGNGTNNTASDSRNNQHSLLKAVRDRKVNANLYTVSIEHEGRLSETNGALSPAQLEATIMLVRHIRTEVRRIFGAEMPLNREHIVGHGDITPRWKPNCPGPDYPFDAIIRGLISAESPGQPKPTAPANIPSPWAKEAWDWAIKNGITDGTNPQNAPTREQMVQLLFNYHRAITRAQIL
jgi:N-acetyl-anhydromuramyl-L-alanine amidase AmpD